MNLEEGKSYYKQLSSVHLAVLDTSFISILVPKPGWLVNRINVPPEYRNKGIGRELLRQLIEEADLNNVILYLEINPYGRKGIDMDYNQLEAWYIRNGFIDSGNGLYTRFPKEQL